MSDIPDRRERAKIVTTAARIGLGRAGDSLPTTPQLEFQLAHARARDAVHGALELDSLKAELATLRVIEVKSRASDRDEYLKRPDLGRRLDPADAARIKPEPCDVAFVIADGLSASAVNTQGAPLVFAARRRLPELSFASVVLAKQARVALGDEVGQLLGADIMVIIIGERPGLSAADSVGIYLTWQPRLGRRDSERNCISNIRPGGLGTDAAADQLAALIRAARAHRLSGVALKQDDAVIGFEPSENRAALPPDSQGRSQGNERSALKSNDPLYRFPD